MSKAHTFGVGQRVTIDLGWPDRPRLFPCEVIELTRGAYLEPTYRVAVDLVLGEPPTPMGFINEGELRARVGPAEGEGEVMR